MHDFHVFKKETQSTKCNVSVIVQTWHHAWFSVLPGSSIECFFNDHSILFFSFIYTLSLSFFLSSSAGAWHNKQIGRCLYGIDNSCHYRTEASFFGYFPWVSALSLIVLGPMRLRWELKNSGENDLAYKLLLCILWSWLSNVICISFLIILKYND